MEKLINTITSTNLSLIELLVILCCAFIVFISVKGIVLLNAFTNQLKVTSKEKLSESQFKLFERAIDKAKQIITSVVIGLNEELVNDIKEKASDGKLTEEERTEILQDAIARVKQQLGDEITNSLSYGIGDIDSWIVSTIHRTLNANKVADTDKATSDAIGVLEDLIINKDNQSSVPQEKSSLKIKEG